MQQIVVMQFAESCLRDAAAIQKIFDIVQKYKENDLVLIVAALPKMKNLLLDCANKADTCSSYVNEIKQIQHQHMELINNLFEGEEGERVQNFLIDKFTHLEEILDDIEEYGLSDNKLDIVLSFGEILSGYIVNEFLNAKKLECEYLLGDKFLITDDKFSHALPIMNMTVRKIRALLVPLLKLNHIPVVTGFIGRTKEGHLTTLGPGGTEYSAALIAYCLKDENIETKVILWMNINGIYTVDPNVISSAQVIKQLSYAEAKELAVGTKILHPKCIQPIQDRGISLEIRNFDAPSSSQYTTIQKTTINRDKIIGLTYDEEAAAISVISESTVEIPGILAKIFDLMGQNDINVSMLSQTSSEITTTFLVPAVDAERAKQLLTDSEFFKGWFEVRVDYVGMLSVIGDGVRNPQNLERIFRIFKLNKTQVLALSQASDGLNITLLLKKEELFKILEALNEEFNLNQG
ncbi:MAG: aspartate kinase [Candidatus Helarchaeota archaeon]|nr:aspartate kinase [Candidatus Helarchaeota archaeon]